MFFPDKIGDLREAAPVMDHPHTNLVNSRADQIFEYSNDPIMISLKFDRDSLY